MNAPIEGPLRVRLDGQAIAPGLALTVAGAFVRQVLNAPTMAEVVFADPSDEEIKRLKIGAPFSLVWGSGEPVFQGEVTGLMTSRDRSGGRQIRLRGYDLLHRLRKRQQVRTAADASARSLAAECAKSLGLACSGGEAAPVRPFVLQHGQSDFDLLVQLAGDAGYYVHLCDGALRLSDLGGAGEALKLRSGRELLEGEVAISAEALRRSSEVETVDLARARPARGRAETASQTLNPTSSAALDAFKGLGERRLTYGIDLDADAARRLAQADLDQAAARGAALTGVALGDPRLRPAARVAVEGLGPLADGPFVLAGALHQFTEDAGYLTEIWSEPPPRRPAPPRPASTVGRVFDVDDPDDLSRVRVKLPACGDIESGWIPLVLTGAGEAKGLVALPEPGDDVLVLFPDGDPSRAVVLGGLFGERSPPGHDARRKGKPRAMVLATPSGAALDLDAASARIELRSGGGDLLSFAPGEAELTTSHGLSVRAGGPLTIEATGDLTLQAPGGRVTIRAAAISLERG